MSRVIIQGGFPLKGEFEASGNKNAAMPIIIASLLVEGISQLENVPNTTDVIRVINQLQALGCDIAYEKSRLEISLDKLQGTRFGNPVILPPQLNLLFVGALIQLSQKVILEALDIKKERVGTHFDILQSFGINIETYDDRVEFSIQSKLKGKEILLGESSVTGTELAILLAVLADGETQIYNAACEPHVQNLIEFLNNAGAKINGIGTNLLKITGVKRLGRNKFVISEDHIEIGSLIGMVAMTRGEAFIRCDNKERILPILMQYEKLGVKATYQRNGFWVDGKYPLQVNAKYKGNQLIIASSPWPNFPSDLISLLVVMATQTDGSTLIHEKLFNSRMYFVDSLNSMGANIIQCDPHRVVVVGPCNLFPTTWETPDIRTGIASLGAGIVCSGKTTIDDAEVLDRVFVNIVGKLQSLGARIEVH